MGHSRLTPALELAPAVPFSGTVYRVCPARFAGNLVSMRGALLHGARFNIKGYFGALYTSLTAETARREIARYFTVPPMDGFVEAAIRVRLTRVLDLTGLSDQLTQPNYAITQDLGLHAWEKGFEGLIAPSAAIPGERNLAVFLDNQHPSWRIELARYSQF